MPYDGSQFTAERICNKADFNGRIFYLVKWQSSFETWEPVDTLGCLELVQEFEDSIRKKNVQKVGADPVMIVADPDTLEQPNVSNVVLAFPKSLNTIRQRSFKRLVIL